MAGIICSRWVLAARPKTLPAAAAPVLCASTLAYAHDAFALTPAFLCLLFALLIQIGTNYANDYYDFRKGADTKERVGPTRAVQAGLITPAAMRRATALVLGLAFCVGLLLIPYGGLWLIGVGLVSIACAVLYTGGPYPLGYNGLGDIFVFIFFGLIAVIVTYYLQAQSVVLEAVLLGAAIGFLSVNLLVVNNTRDLETDKKAGKRTVVVRFGRKFASAEIILNLCAVFILTLLLPLLGQVGWGAALPLLLIPYASIWAYGFAKAKQPQVFALLLQQSAILLILYTLLFCIGLVIIP